MPRERRRHCTREITSLESASVNPGLDCVRQRIPLEVPLPGVSLQDYADSIPVVLRRVREMVRDGEVETIRVPYRGRMVTRIIGR